MRPSTVIQKWGSRWRVWASRRRVGNDVEISPWGLPEVGTPRAARMPGRSGSANGRESTADENLPVPGRPRRLILLHELPSPSSDWTARQPHALAGGSDERSGSHHPVRARAPRVSGPE
jgi:hypothetical protein